MQVFEWQTKDVFGGTKGLFLTLLFDVGLTLAVEVSRKLPKGEAVVHAAELADMLNIYIKPLPLGYVQDVIHVCGHTIALIGESFKADGLIDQKSWAPSFI